MRSRESRYKTSKMFEDEERFSGYRERELTLPDGVIEHRVISDDRLDHMAQNYYKKDRRWWRILDANADYLYGFDLSDDSENGVVIMIPAARDSK